MTFPARLKYTALAFAGLGITIFALLVDGAAAEFIDVRLLPLVLMAGLALIVLAQLTLSWAQKTEKSDINENLDISKETGWQLSDILWLAVPVIISLIFAY